MQPSAVAAVRHVIEEYRRFLKTSYRFLDDRLREQFERHLAEAGVVVKGPYVTLSRGFERNRTLVWRRYLPRTEKTAEPNVTI